MTTEPRQRTAPAGLFVVRFLSVKMPSSNAKCDKLESSEIHISVVRTQVKSNNAKLERQIERTHNPKVVGSNPAPATTKHLDEFQDAFLLLFSHICCPSR